MAKPTHIKVLLLRSGQSTWDVESRLSGSVDLPLSPQARGSLEATIAQLDCDPLKCISAGPEETARIAAEMLARRCEARVKVCPALHEVSLGLWEGMLASEAAERHKSVYRQWRDDPTAIVPPGGESLEDAAQRLSKHIREILNKRKTDPSSGVGIVLRPMAYGLVHCWLSQQPIAHLWQAMESEEGHAWFQLDRSTISRKTPVLTAGVREAV